MVRVANDNKPFSKTTRYIPLLDLWNWMYPNFCETLTMRVCCLINHSCLQKEVKVKVEGKVKGKGKGKGKVKEKRGIMRSVAFFCAKNVFIIMMKWYEMALVVRCCLFSSQKRWTWLDNHCRRIIKPLFSVSKQKGFKDLTCDCDNTFVLIGFTEGICVISTMFSMIGKNNERENGKNST